jgi:hypothetical protein
MSFFRSGALKHKITTKTGGEYEGEILPGEYTIEVDLPNADMTIYQADVDDFDDPIKHYYLTGTGVEGFNLAGLHVFEVAIPYGDVTLEMDYDESKVADEGNLRAWKCSNWSNLNRKCNSSWREVGAEIDTISNKVTVDTESLSAFAIGVPSNLTVSYKLDDQDYPVSSPIKVSGVVVDSGGNVVSGASVKASVRGTSESASAVTDSNGLFSISLTSPEAEGNYTLDLKVSKSPFKELEKESKLNVVRYRLFTLTFPDMIKARAGEEFTQSVKIVNTGQSDLYGLKVEVEGLEDYYVTPLIEKLEKGEERNLPLSIRVPEDANSGTRSAKIRVYNKDSSREKIFGLVISGAPTAAAEKEEGPDLFTGMFVALQGGTIKAPQLFSTFVYVGIFAASAFAVSFLLKRRKRRGKGSEDVRRHLIEAKSHLSMERNRAHDRERREREEKEREKAGGPDQEQEGGAGKTYSAYLKPSDRFEGLSDLEKTMESARDDEERTAGYGG